MGRLLILAALGATACGKVALLADAAPDPDALVCRAEQLACGDQCVDPMADHGHCGACDIACSDADDCVAGHCTDTTTSCFEIKFQNPSATDGMYTHRADGSQFYCDMTNMMEYDELDMLQYDVGHAGFTIVTAADLQNPSEQAAFIALYNLQHGLKVTTAWSSGNCCFKADSVVNTNMLTLGGSLLFPAAGGVTSCNPVGGYLTTAPYQFLVSASGSAAIDPLPADYFTTHPASVIATCASSSNPAFFWKRHP